MAEETEVIEHQMEETRKALAEKVEALEKQVVSTVKDTTQTVTETVADVKEAVQETVGTVGETVQKTVETVKETFDFRKLVENRPWVAVGGAVTVGYLLGAMLSRGSSAGSAPESSGAPEPDEEEPEPEPAQCAPAYEEPQHADGHQQPGFLSSLAPVLDRLKGLAIGTTTGVFGEVLRSALPEAIRGEVSKMVERVTTALGGTPIHPRKEG